MRGATGWRDHALPLAILVAGVAIAFIDVIGPARGLFFRDHTMEFGWRAVGVRESLLGLHLPAMTGRDSSGVPLEQLLNATYTPTTLVLLAGPLEVAYDLFVAAHFVVLGLGVYGFASSLGASRREACLAAVVGSLAGPVLSLENLIIAVAGLSYAPWVWWALLAVLRRPTPGRTAALALATSFHAQGVLPEFVFLDAIVFVLLVLEVRPRPGWRLAAALGGAGALAFGIASISIMPVLEALAGTRRGMGFTYDAISGWALAPPLFLELLAPAVWTPPDIPFLNPPAITGNGADPLYLVSLYFGTVLAVAAAAGLNRRLAPLWGGALFFLLVAMGRHTPIHRILASLPLLNHTRYAIKYMVVVTAALAALAPAGLRALTQRPVRLATWAILQLLLLIVVLQILYADEFREYLATQYHGFGSQTRIAGLAPQTLPEIAVGAMRVRFLHALIASAALALVAGVAVLASRRRPLPASWEAGLSWALIMVVAADLATGANLAIFGVEIDRQRFPAEVARVIGAEDRRWFYDPTSPAEVQHVAGHTYFEDEVASFGRRGLNVLPEVRRYLDIDLNGQSNFWHARVFDLVWRAPAALRHAIVARAGVSTMSSRDAGLTEPLLLRYPVLGEVDELVYRIADARPYVAAYARWRTIDPRGMSDDDVLAAFASTSAGVALIEGAGAEAPASRTSSACAPGARLLGRDRRGRIEVEVTGGCEALVVAMEPVVTGWKVEVDGVEARLLTTEVGYLGVMVPPGAHRVRFFYRPLLTPWIPVCLASLLVTLGLFMLSQVRARAAPRGA